MNWGKGIAIFLTVFVLFILGLVYMTTRSTFDLEVEDYYAQEITYQDRIDALSAGSKYEGAFKMHQEEEEFVLQLSTEAPIGIETGTISFYRPNDSRLDRSYVLNFEEGKAVFSKSEFVIGKYEVRIEWKSEGEDHAVVQDFEMS